MKGETMKQDKQNEKQSEISKIKQ
ncbi:TPA: DNA polymerase III, partial [Clostridioides difficile]|nr:DNA polymerase III [Clostridioides difficile]